MKLNLKSVNGRFALQCDVQNRLSDVVLVVLEVGQDGLVEGDPEFGKILLAEVRRSRNVEIRVEAVDVAADRVSLKFFFRI